MPVQFCFVFWQILIVCICLVFQEGLILVGGNTMSEVCINLNALAAKQQSIVGVPKGTLKQLLELVDLVAEQKVSIGSLHIDYHVISVIKLKFSIKIYPCYNSIYFALFQVKPPVFSIHDITDANQVFEDLYQSRITGRAILKINHSQTVDN